MTPTTTLIGLSTSVAPAFVTIAISLISDHSPTPEALTINTTSLSSLSNSSSSLSYFENTSSFILFVLGMYLGFPIF
jgi:hypothetical protein